MPEIHSLQPVDLREAWPNEAQDFTPWLAEHLDRLGAELNLDLEQPQKEAILPGAGRVDILAKQARTDATVVIENQLGPSDDSHLLRLLGYAANAEANILVWAAREFTDYHRRILDWLNRSDTIDVYGAVVKAYRVRDTLAADFRTVVEPPQERPGTSYPARETISTHYAEFYRPLVAQLRRSGIQPVGRGGWRGRWRSFQTGYPRIVYATGLFEGKVQLFLSLHGADQREIYHALTQHRAEIDTQLDGPAVWEPGERESTVMLEKDAAVTSTEENFEAVRRWMADNLLRLQAVMQPYLEKVMGQPDAEEHDAGEPE